MTEPQIIEVDNPSRPELNSVHFLNALYGGFDRWTMTYHRQNYYVWRDARWHAVDKETVESIVYGLFRNAVYANADGDAVPFTCQGKYLGDLIRSVRNETLVDRDINVPAWLEGNVEMQINIDPPLPAREVIAARNCLVHATTRRWFAHTPRFFNTTAVNYDYLPDAPPPTNWLAFLQELWPDDAESIDTLQEIFGYCVTTRTDLQKMFMLLGPPRSGKGTIVRVLTALLGGESSVTSVSLTDMNSPFGLESLENRQLGIMQDARFGARNTSNAVERLLSITGEDEVSINKKGQAIYSAKLPTRFLLVSNEIPILKDESGALRTRIIMLKTRETVDETRRDSSLAERLYVELPSILNWALDGLDRLDRRGFFQQPKSAEPDVEYMSKLSSDMEAFADDCLVLETEAMVTHHDFYEAYKAWCVKHGIRVPNSGVVGRNVRAKLNLESAQRTQDDGSRPRCYLGARLNEEAAASVSVNDFLNGL